MHDPDLHLLADDAEVQHVVNLRRVINRPRKQATPVVVSDQPWEGARAQAWGSVIKEPDGRLRMWYFAFNAARRPDELDRGGYALAQSTDGITWHKPALGIVEFRGSRRNNLWYTFSPDGHNLVDEELARRGQGLPAQDQSGAHIGVVNNMDGLTVVRDEQEPDPQQRYKLIANMQDHRMWAPSYQDRYPAVTDQQVQAARAVWGQYLDTSPDGVHWTRRPRRVLPARHGDYMLVTRDQANDRWWLNERAQVLFGRNVALRTSTDLINWDAPRVVFSSDASMGFGRDFEWHGGITPFNYGNMHLGLLEKWSNVGFGDSCELVCSRDGLQWQRVAPGFPFLDVGAEGAFDRVLAYPSHNAPIRMGDELFIYYTGAGPREDHGALPMSIGLARVRLDRFVGMAHSRREPGELLTRPFRLLGTGLEVNAEMLLNRVVQVAVRGSDGSIEPGYDFADSQVALDRDRARVPVLWKGKDLADLRDHTIALHFRVDGCCLYAYRISGRPS